MMTPDLERAIPVVGFVGPSGVGKTSLVERLVTELKRRGLSVGAVKHASHGFLADRPGKDSHRLYESGADAVALISRVRGVGVVVSLAEALATLPRDLDLVLAEGFSWEPIPRVVLLRDDEEPAPAHVQSGEVLDVVNIPNPPYGEKPEYPETLVAMLTHMLEARVREAGGTQHAGGGKAHRTAVHESAA